MAEVYAKATLRMAGALKEQGEGAEDAPASAVGRPPGQPFGDELKALREEHAISQPELARVLRLKQPYIAGVETGGKPVSEKQKRRIRLAIRRIVRERAAHRTDRRR